MADENVVVTFTGDASSLTDALNKISGQSEQTSSIVQTGLGVALGGVLVQALEAVAEKAKEAFDYVADSVSKFGDWAETVKLFTERMGTSAEAGSTFAEAMQHVGLDVESGSAQLAYFAKQLSSMTDAETVAADKSTIAQAKHSQAIDTLRDSITKAQERLMLAEQNLDHAKVKTDAMRVAVSDARMNLENLNQKMADLSTQSTDATVKLSPFAQALKQLGIQAFDSHGQLKDFQTIMPQIMDAFKNLPAGVQATDIAMQLFGARGGPKFMEFLREGSAGLKDATKRAQEFGLMLNDEGVAAAEAYGRSLNDLKQGINAIQVNLGAALLPLFQRFVTFINEHIVPAILDFVIPAFEKMAGWIDSDGIPAFQALFGELSRFWQEIAPQLKEIFDKITGWLNEQKAVWTLAWQYMQGVLQVAWRLFQSEIKVALDIITGHFDRIIPDLKRIWAGLWDTLGLELKLKIFELQWAWTSFWNNLHWVFEQLGMALGWKIKSFWMDLQFAWGNALFTIESLVNDFVFRVSMKFEELEANIRNALGMHSPPAVFTELREHMRTLNADMTSGVFQLQGTMSGVIPSGGSRGGIVATHAGGYSGGMVINVPITIQPLMLTADRYQAEQVLRPIIDSAIRTNPQILRLQSR